MSEITKENLEKMVKKVVEINKIDEYILICNPLNTALKQEDLANNVELRHNPYCPIDKGYLIRKKDYLDI